MTDASNPATPDEPDPAAPGVTDSSPAGAAAASDANPDAGVPRPRSLRQRVQRLGGHLFWYMLEYAVNLGLPQLLLFPLCMHWAGENVTGLFLGALGVVNIAGLAPGRGLNNCILRNLSSLPPERQEPVLRTAFTLAAVVVSGLAVVAIAICLGLEAGGSGEDHTALWVAILVVAMAAQNLAVVGAVDLAIKRLFKQRMLWRSLGGVLCLLALPAYAMFGPLGLVIGYTLGHVLALVVMIYARRTLIFGEPQYEPEVGRRLGATWAFLSLPPLFFLSSRYIHRTVLFALTSASTVSVFFAGAAMLDLLLTPFSVLGLFGFQLLGAHSSRRALSARLLKLYAIALPLSVPLLWGMISLVAPLLLRTFYPKVADDALEPMRIMMPGLAASLLTHGSRLFVVKFSHRNVLVLIGGISACVHVGLSLVLTRMWGIAGASLAFSIGSGVIGAVWYGFFLHVMLRPGHEGNEADGSVDQLD